MRKGPREAETGPWNDHRDRAITVDAGKSSVGRSRAQLLNRIDDFPGVVPCGSLRCMSRSEGKPSNKIPIAIAIVGILIELVAIVLLASKRVSVPVGMPLVMAGMLMAFVPVFVLARRAKHRR